MTNKLYILCGIPFAGKSTIARKIVELTGFTHIDLDQIKFELFGNNITDDQIDQSGWDQIYQRMYSNIEHELSLGKTVLHDTGNFTRHERSLVSMIATKLNIPFQTIYIDTPKELAYNRLLANRWTTNRFDITEEAFYSAAAEMEIPEQSENPLIINPSTDIATWVAQFIK